MIMMIPWNYVTCKSQKNKQQFTPKIWNLFLPNVYGTTVRGEKEDDKKNEIFTQLFS